jgi:hypothetical protein
MPGSVSHEARAAARTLALLLTATGSAQAATYSVGADSGSCDFASVQLAVQAAETNPGADTIRIAVGSYVAQAIEIDSQALTLEGGYASCSATAPTAVTRLDGAGGSADSVIAITGLGNDVRLRHLQIVGGDEVDDGYGGGIQAGVGGQLLLSDVEVANNRAGYGGGIHAEGIVLILGANVRVVGNDAQASGGGIRLTHASLRADADGIYIGFNDAGDGNGGGIALVASNADLGSPGLGGLPLLHANRAAYGGGIAILTSSLGQGPSRVRMYSTDATRPVRVSGNIASAIGGAVYLKPSMDVSLDSATATLCASDFRFDDNVAVEGSALYADSDYSIVNDLRSTQIHLNPVATCDGVPARPAHAQRCLGRAGCNTIDGNFSDDDGAPGNGATILVQNAGEFDARQVILRGNVGGRLLRAFGDIDSITGRRATLRCDGCLMVENTLTLELIRLHDAHAYLSLLQSTVAGNAAGGGALVQFDSGEDTRFTLQRSLLAQPGLPILAGGPGTRTIADLVAHELASVPEAQRARQAPPRFYDPEDGDYRLQAASPAVDYAAGSGADDLDARPRARDLPIVPDAHGRLDLGAYERQEVGNLVRNFEFPERAGGPPALFRLWTQTSALSTWSTEDASGGRGSVYLAFTPDVTPGGASVAKQGVSDITGLSQCIHLPGPGRYALSAYARVPGSNAMLRDYARLDWTFRSNDASCSATPTAQGSHVLARSSSWSLGPPAFIDVAPDAWTSNSTIQLVMRVSDGNPLPESTIDAYFDAVRLVPAELEASEMFRDGFEN